MGIQQKIIIPFALLIIAAVVITGALVIPLNTARVQRQAAEEENRRRMRDEMKRVKEILALDIPVTEPLLKRIKPLFEGQVILTDASNRPTLATIDGAHVESIHNLLRAPEKDAALPAITRATAGTRDFYVVADRLPKTGGYVYLAFEAGKIGGPPEAPVTAIMIVAGAALVAVLGVGVWIARTITRPIKELARRAGEITGGELDRPVDVRGGRETNALADALNKMLAGLKDYQNKLVASEKLAALGQVAAGIAHEIRNPLNSISMNVQMMEREGKLDTESMRIIRGEIERLKMVIDELLDFARTPADEPVRCDLKDLAGEVLDLMRRLMEHCKIAVETEFAASGRVFADANRLKQVLMNLLLNAVQAMPAGGRIALKTEDRVAAGSPTVRCSVRDAGGGVPEQYGEKIFQPFFTTREGGSGLGLAICKRIIEDHKGTIGFANNAVGATFWFELPAEQSV
jgi:signal transduction histidine kinase